MGILKRAEGTSVKGKFSSLILHLKTDGFFIFYIGTVSLLIVAATTLSAAKQTKKSCQIDYPGFTDSDYRQTYPLLILGEALAAASDKFGPCTLVANNVMSQKRAAVSLQNGDIDVAWLPANKYLEKSLSSIKIPIRKGLLGWRAILTNKRNYKSLQKIENLAGLQQYQTAYLKDWHDWPVMLANFPKLGTASSYRSLFTLLQRNRIVFLSRALHEVVNEQKRFDVPPEPLMVLPGVLLHYPQADLFYFPNKPDSVRGRVLYGLEQLMKSGKFDKLFKTHHQEILKTINATKKRLIKLTNPFLPEDLNLYDKMLWFTP